MILKKLKKTVCIFILFGLIFSDFLIPVNQAKSADEKIITVTFKTAPTPSSVSVVKAPIKYNKKFAFSYTFDDGYIEGYNPAFRYMHGGYVSELEETVGGLYYTDGAGYRIPFKGAFNWISNSSSSFGDLHINTPGNMTWDNLRETYALGWEPVNHGWTSRVTPTPADTIIDYPVEHGGPRPLDYDYEVTQNTARLQAELGATIKHFGLPAGDPNYIPAALANGMKSISTGQPGSSDQGLMNVASTLNLEQMQYKRKFFAEATELQDMKDYLDKISNDSTGGDNYWGVASSHRVRTPVNPPDNGNLSFDNFKDFMNYASDTYGVNGNDSMWMASAPEVYEYLVTKQKTSIETSLSGNILTITLDTSLVDNDLRRYALSLIVNADAEIDSISYEEAEFTHHSENLSSGLINLDWGFVSLENDITRAETLVSIAELSKAQVDIDTARTYVILLENSLAKTSFFDRLDSIEVNLKSWKINFGNNGYTSGVWNEYGGNLTSHSTLTLNDSDNTPSSVTVKIQQDFSSKSSSTGMTTGNNSGYFPDSYLAGMIRMYSADTNIVPGIVRLGGLDVNKRYKIVLMGSHSLVDVTTDKTKTVYSINNVEKELQTSMNTSEVITYENISPDIDGNIDISVAKKFAHWGYGILNALEISEERQYTLTYSAGSNGIILGNTYQAINHGEDGSEVEATPDEGYYFLKWDDNLETAKRTDTNVQSCNTFTAIFQEITSFDYKNLVVVGASLMFNSFGSSLEEPHSEATQRLREMTGINDLNVYGYGFSGLKMVDYDKQDENMIEKLEQAYEAFPGNDTLFLIDTGGNDMTSMSPSRAYNLITSEQLEKFQDDLDAVFEKVNERNGDVIVADLTFRSYRNPLDPNSAENFLEDFSGSGPYIENEFRSRQMEHQPHFLNTDDRSVVDKYNFIRNNWTALLHTDGVHLNSSSYSVFRDFILERVAYLFTGDDMPDPVDVEFNEHSELIIVDIGTTYKQEYNERLATHHPVNFSAITNTSSASTLLKTITGKDVGSLILSTSVTDLNSDNIGISTNTILPGDENAFYKNWQVYSKEIMKTSLYFNEGESVAIKLTGLEINSEYNINFVGSTNEVDGGYLNLSDVLSLNEDEILTTKLAPEIGSFIAETNFVGELELVAVSSDGRGYLSGISAEYIGPMSFEDVVMGEVSDAVVRYRGENDTIQIFDILSDGLHIGNRSSSNLLLYKAVYVFELPEIPSSKILDNVILTLHHSGRDGVNDITYEVDLRGLRYSSSNTVVLGDYSAEGVLIQEGILNKALSPSRYISTSESGSSNLVDWINGMYGDGATAGDYIFLRLEPDSIPANITINSFRVDSANISDEEKRPKLLLEYALRPHTVTFRDWDGEVLKTESVEPGSGATAPVDPSRVGYVFAGWIPSDFTNVVEDVNITAQYSANEYTLTFDPVNGSVYPLSKEVVYDSTVGELPTPVKSGHIFNSWNSQESGEGVTYIPETAYGVADDVTIFAQWTPINYTITYDKNNEDVIGFAPIDLNSPYNIGDTVTVLGSGDLSLPGHTLVDWNTQSNGDGTTYSLSQQFFMPAENIILYARWNPNDYNVTFKAGGGDGSDYTQSITFGSSTNLAANIFTRMGYEFTGWNTLEDGSGDTYSDGSFFAMNSEGQDLFAQWSLERYTVNFRDWNGDILKTESLGYGSGATAPDNPSRIGHTFIGWDLSFNNIIEDLDVVAQYMINQYTITFDSDGGTALDPITQNFGATITAPSNPTKEGYIFNGWSPGLPKTMPESGLHHTAQWIANKHVLTYMASDNGLIEGLIFQTVDHGEGGTEVTAVPSSGYNFQKWSDGLTNATRIDLNILEDTSFLAFFARNDNSGVVYLPGSIGDGQTHITVIMNGVGSIGQVDGKGVNYLSYINSQASFIAPISSTNNLSDHKFIIDNLDLLNNLVTFTIKSDPQTFQLSLGEKLLVDLDKDGVSDIEINFIDIYINRIELTIKSTLDREVVSTPTGHATLNREDIIQEARNSFKQKNIELSKRLSGQILLQVEKHGQAWYLEPQSKVRYFLGRPADAFAIMRYLGLGVSENNFNKFKNSGAPSHLAGRIVIRPEANGEAYYINPNDLKLYYLGRPADAFAIMQKFALGVLDEILDELEIDEIYDSYAK